MSTSTECQYATKHRLRPERDERDGDDARVESASADKHHVAMSFSCHSEKQYKYSPSAILAMICAG